MNTCHNHNKCITTSLETAQKICDENNLRFTDLRQKIFTIILQSHKPSKAYDVLEILQKEDPSAKPITIYRSLDFLLENGLIHKIHSLNSFVICSHPQKHSGCSFLICTKCHEIAECCDEKITQGLQQIQKENNFHIHEATIEIKGVCGSCL